MRTFEPGTTVRVMQEDWGVFQNLPRDRGALRGADRRSTVEVTLTVIPEMWELMERSFSGEDPPFDLVGVRRPAADPGGARRARRAARRARSPRDGYSLDDFTTPGARAR